MSSAKVGSQISPQQSLLRCETTSKYVLDGNAKQLSLCVRWALKFKRFNYHVLYLCIERPPKESQITKYMHERRGKEIATGLLFVYSSSIAPIVKMTAS